MSTSRLDTSLVQEYTIRQRHLASQDWGDSFSANPLHAVKTESITFSSLNNSIPVVIVTSQDNDDSFDLPC